MAANVLLLSVLSDVYSESITQLKILVDCYDVFSPLISDSKFGRFSRSLRELRSVKEALKERYSMGAPLSDAKRILTKALTISEMDFVNELPSDAQRKMWMEIEELGMPVERKLEDPMRGKDQNVNVSTNSLRVASEEDNSVEKNGVLKKKKKLKRKIKDVKDNTQASGKKKKLKRKLQERIRKMVISYEMCTSRREGGEKELELGRGIACKEHVT
uniref:UBN2 domain-containing protein n=1 Tax=Ascaris lumbricoides TaxID=6252 RepID=A0A0M3I0R4_ASCLU